MVLSQVGAAALAAGRVEDPVLSYLIVWMLPLAAFAWFGALITGLDQLGHRSHRPLPAGLGSRLHQVAALVLALVAVVQVVRVWPQVSDPPLPRATFAVAVSDLVDQLDGRIPDGLVRIEGVGDEFYQGWVGVVGGLDRRGVDFVTSDGAAGQKWGPDNIWHGQPVVTVLTMATYLPTVFHDPIEVCDDDPGVQRLAAWDQLSEPERARLKGLQILNYQRQGRLDAADASELADLSARSWRLVVFAGPHPCG